MSFTDRRAFLKSSVTLAAVLPLARLSLDAAETPVTAASAPGGKRGMFFDAADLPRIRANLAHPRFAVIAAELTGTDHAAEGKFLREGVRLNDHITDFGRVLHILQTTALAFLIYNRPEDLATAQLALQRILDYPKWDYFLEGGKQVIGFQRAPEGTIAVCSALDWLDGHLSPEIVAEAERQVATKGAPACYIPLYGMKYPDRVRGWSFDPEERDVPMKIDFRRWPLILNATNLKVIPTAALGIAAAWLHGRHPEADKWLQLSRQSAQAFSVMYGADGAYDEGAGYAGYTTMHLAMLADVLYRRLGIDDRKLINYPGHVRYALTMAMPTKGAVYSNPNESKLYNAVPKGALDPALDLVNFGDGGVAIDVSFAGWVARNEHDPLSQYVASNVGVVKLVHAAFWHQPDAPVEAPTAALHDVRMSNDWVISRTGWKPEDAVVALRSGGPANHEHADRNSVIFKAYGERLFTDHFKAAYVPTHPRWVLRLTEGHTSVLIDGKGHQYHDGHEGTNASWAWARVLAYRTGPGWMSVTSDATDAYQLVNDTVQQVERTLLFLKPDVLVILDRVKLATAQPMQVRFQIFSDDAKGEASVEDGAFRIKRPFAHALATTHSPGRSLACAVGHLPVPATEGQFPFVEVTSAAATEHEILTVCAAAPTGETAARLDVKHAGNTWRITGTHLGRSLDAQINSSSAQPTITVA